MTATINLPATILNKAVVAVGTPGAGKSHGVAEAIVIPALERHEQVVIVDPTDAWFGLALSRDGKKPSGLDIAVIGGEHGQIPLTPNMGTAMGDLLGREPISAILSLAHLELDEQIQFVSDFSRAIMKVNRKPIRLIYDEADEFCPERPELGKELFKCRLSVRRIVTRGRKPGFRPVLITQRPQALSVAARNLCQVMMAFQCAGHHERKQIKDYVENNGDPATMKTMLETLGQLRVGEAWVWAPREKFLERVQFPKIKTYDSFKDLDETTASIAAVPISDKQLGVLRKSLEEFEEQRRANDPEELRNRVADLESQLADRPNHESATASPEELEAQFAAGYADGEIEGRKAERAALLPWVRDWQGVFAKSAQTIKAALSDLEAAVDNPPELEPIEASTPTPPRSTAIRDVQREPFRTERPPKSGTTFRDGKLTTVSRAGGGMNGTALKKAEQGVLDGIAWWMSIGINTPTKAQLCAIAGYSPTASTIGVYLAALRRAELVAGDAIKLTPKGVHAANHPDAPPNRRQLREHIKAVMSSAESNVMDAIAAQWPKALSRDELCKVTGYSSEASTIGVYLAALRRYGFIERREIKAVDWLFR